MLTIPASLDGREVTAAFREWQRLGRDGTPLMRAIGVGLVSVVQDHFDEEKDPFGNAWVPLNPLYATDKKGPGILRESGMRGGLQGSITFDANRDEVSVGSNKIHAGVHQFGATIHAVNAPALVFTMGGELFQVQSVSIPARPYLGIGPAEEDVILDVTEVMWLRGRRAPL